MCVATAQRKRNHGTGSVYFNEKENVWIGAYTVGKKPNGKPDVKHVRGKTEAECHRKLNKLIDESKKSDYVYVQKDTLENYLDNWLTTVKRLQLKPKSYDRLEQTIRKDVAPAIGQIQIGALTTADVQKMIADMQANDKSRSSIKKAYDAVNAAYKWGLKCTPPAVRSNPCSGVELPGTDKFDPVEIKFYTADEARKISEVALQRYKKGTPWYPLGGLVVVGLNTGLRVGELAALEWDRDIDMEARLLYVHKNVVVVKDRSKDAKRSYTEKEQNSTKTDAGQDRVIPLNDDAIAALNTLKQVTGNSKYVFATKDGNRKSLRDLDKIVRRVIRRAGFPEEKVYGPHSLRHTFATLLLSNGVDVKVVSELLGHSSVMITYNTYIHVIKEQKAKALSSLPNFITASSKSETPGN